MEILSKRENGRQNGREKINVISFTILQTVFTHKNYKLALFIVYVNILCKYIVKKH